MNLLQSLMDRLRALVGSKGWDFCILWKLSEDHRFLQWMDCCCGGTENAQNGVTIVNPCRDLMFSHPRVKSCDLLAQQHSDIPLDSGVHAESLISNQPKWLNFSNSSDSDIIFEVGTRVLIPVPGGLFELFVAKQVSEDQNVIDYVSTQCNISFEQEAMMMNSNNMDTTNLPYEISVDRISLCNSPMNILQQFHYNLENKSKSNMFNENSHDQFKSSTENGILVMNNAASNMHMEFMEPLVNKEMKQGNDKDSMKHETGRTESVSDCSDQVDDDETQTYGRKNGKEPQSKNLVAERKRRKKLNDRLYALRALVPKISKLDRASILGDAIEYVKELQKQAKELQDKLEEHSDDEDDKNTASNILSSEILSQTDNTLNGFHVASEPSVQNHGSVITTEKTQQMEPQVEVSQLGTNEFFVKVFCEHKAGGFVRLIEALNSLGLEVSNANVTSFRTLVSNVFSVEKRDSEMIEAHNLRDSLLELTRNTAENGGGGHVHHLMNSHHHHF